jgi:hypothetical protein
MAYLKESYVHAMRHTGGTEVWLHSFFNLALDRGEWSTACPTYFIPKKVPHYPLNRKLGGFEEEKISFLCCDSNPPLSRSPSLHQLCCRGS